MPVDEETRHDVYEDFKRVHGTKRAAAIMEMLPPAGVPELATKADIEKLEGRLGSLEERFGSLEERFGSLEGALRDQTDRYVRWLLTGLIAMTSVIIMVFGAVTAIA